MSDKPKCQYKKERNKTLTGIFLISFSFISAFITTVLILHIPFFRDSTTILATIFFIAILILIITEHKIFFKQVKYQIVSEKITPYGTHIRLEKVKEE